MLTKNKIKFIKSLDYKKSRIESQCFVVEGEKMVKELLLSGFQIQTLIISKNAVDFPSSISYQTNIEVLEVIDSDMEKISSQKSPQGVLAIATIPNYYFSDKIPQTQDTQIVLDDIQDPGNLGTIIRTADWFGVKQIICSKNTVDVFNPKVIQATMGAIFRVQVVYADLKPVLVDFRKENPQTLILAAVLGGENIYKLSFQNPVILMMGNESKGLSQELIDLASHKISIPNFGDSTQQSESLNVSIATSILLSELKRNLVK